MYAPVCMCIYYVHTYMYINRNFVTLPNFSIIVVFYLIYLSYNLRIIDSSFVSTKFVYRPLILRVPVCQNKKFSRII